MTTFVSPVRSFISEVGEQWDLQGSVCALVHDDNEPMYLSQDGTAGNYVRTIDKTAYNLAGKDWTLTTCFAVVDYTSAAQVRLAAQYGSVGNLSWLFYLLATSGAPALWTSSDGTNLAKNFSVANPGWTDGATIILQAKFRYNDSGVSTVEFYHGTPNTPLALLGTKQAHTGLVSLFNSTHNLSVGAESLGGVCINGKIYWAEMYNDTNSAMVFRFDPNRMLIEEDGLSDLNAPRSIPATLAPATEASIAPSTIVISQGVDYDPAFPEVPTDAFIWAPKSASKRKAPRVLKAPFGDGYEQRLADGINNSLREWSLSWTRVKAEIDDIDNFLDTCNGVKAFSWTDPDGITAMWICEEWNRSPVDESQLVHTLSAIFKQRPGV